MSKIGKYSVVRPDTNSIQHIFDSFEDAEGWMKNARATGYIALVVGEVKMKKVTSLKSEKLIEYAEQLRITGPSEEEKK